jgi:hypothetical protein
VETYVFPYVPQVGYDANLLFREMPILRFEGLSVKRTPRRSTLFRLASWLGIRWLLIRLRMVTPDLGAFLTKPLTYEQIAVQAESYDEAREKARSVFREMGETSALRALGEPAP